MCQPIPAGTSPRRPLNLSLMHPTRFASCTLAALLALGMPAWAVVTELAAAPARASSAAKAFAFDGVVEAVRPSVLAAQVSAAVVRLGVKVGDRVVAGQVLLRIDAHAADQRTAAGQARYGPLAPRRSWPRRTSSARSSCSRKTTSARPR